MPLYTMTNNEIASVPEADFALLGIKERGDLQRLLRANVNVIAPDTLVIAEEFGSWDEASRRIDLLAVDKDANLVVIELKRDQEGGHMELQALRYAAMVARMTFEQAVEAYREFLAKIESQLDPQASLLEFLGWSEPTAEGFAQDVRIVLVAADFSQEITSTVLWLNERDLDIRCVRLQPYQLDGKLLLNVEQIIPLPEAADYQIQIREKKQEERESSLKQRGEFTLNTLIEHDVLHSGDRLQLVRMPRSGLTLPNEQAKLATFEGKGHHGIKWEYDGKRYSLSLLCRKVCEIGGTNIGPRATFRGPDYWGLEGDSRSLTERAAALSRANSSQETPRVQQLEAKSSPMQQRTGQANGVARTYSPPSA